VTDDEIVCVLICC